MRCMRTSWNKYADVERTPEIQCKPKNMRDSRLKKILDKLN